MSDNFTHCIGCGLTSAECDDQTGSSCCALCGATENAAHSEPTEVSS